MKLIITNLGFILFISSVFGSNDPILVTETTVKINAMGIAELYFGFEKGDEIIFNFELIKGKDLKELEIFEYPETSVFMDFKTSKVEDKSIKVSKRGIYKFRFGNKAMGSRVAKVKIERIPASVEREDFGTSVYWRTVSDTTFYMEQEKYLVNQEYITKTIVPSAKFYVNGGLNATLQGGKSRITFPVSLPNNTVEWYYQFSATRDENEIKRTQANFNLASDLTKLIDETGIISSGIDALTQPPGANYCDIYLLDKTNAPIFLAKESFLFIESGTRKNIKSGLVQMKNVSNRNLTIGVKNPSSQYGIHFAIEVVAIVLEKEWGMRDVEKFKVELRDEPYMNH